MTNVKRASIVTIAGTRPEIIKLAEFNKKMKGKFKEDHVLLYTGQHYSENMKEIFFDELGIQADYDLKCNSSDVELLRKKIVPFLKEVQPRYIIVYGDTYSTMAGTLAALELKKIKVIHLEAGIRDLDMTIPEERVRTYVDSVSDYLIAPTELARTFLYYEGIKDNVFVTGNLIFDVCKKMARLADNYPVEKLPPSYLLATMHRPENVDDPDNLARLAKHLSTLGQKVVFPIHPRTKNNLIKYNITLPKNVIGIDAVGYLEFLYLLKNCDLVMTDSGGVTEEAMILKKPCITLRHSTARWETILLKANVLFPLDRKDSLGGVVSVMLKTRITGNPYGTNVTEKTFDLVRKITK